MENYNEQERNYREANRAAREKFFKGSGVAQDKERRAQNEKTAAAFDVAQKERERVQAAADLAEHEKILKNAIRASYVAAAGSDAGFESAYEGLRAQYIAAQTLAGVRSPTPQTKLAVKKTLDLHYGIGAK